MTEPSSPERTREILINALLRARWETALAITRAETKAATIEIDKAIVEAQLAALHAHGLRIVPEVPTAEMRLAARRQWNVGITPVWRAMLAASPEAGGER